MVAILWSNLPVLLFFPPTQTWKRIMASGTASLKASDHRSPQGPHAICPACRHNQPFVKGHWAELPSGACPGTPVASYQEVVDVTLLHRLRGCNHAADWITGYFDLNLLILNSCWDLGHLRIGKLTFWELNPDGVGYKQWDRVGGRGVASSSKLNSVNPAAYSLRLRHCGFCRGRNEAEGWCKMPTFRTSSPA